MAMAREAPPTGFLAEIGAARIAAVAAVVVLALAVQSTLLVKATVLRVIPQLTLVVVVSFAFADGSRMGAVTGFAAGLLQDLLLPQSIVGLTAFVYTLMGYGVGIFSQLSLTQSVWGPVIAVAAASAVAELSYAILSIILGQPWVSVGFTVRVVGLVVLYNTLLTPFTYPLVRRVADRFRPERIYHL